MLKGKLLVGQSGGPTPVINASLAGVILAAQGQTEIEAYIGMVHGIEGALKDELIDLGRESQPTIQDLVHTPALLWAPAVIKSRTPSTSGSSKYVRLITSATLSISVGMIRWTPACASPTWRRAPDMKCR